MIRWLSGLIGAVVVILLLLYLPKEGVQGIVVLLSLFGLWEYFGITQHEEPWWMKGAGLTIGGTMTTLLIFWAKGADQFLALFAVSLMGTLVLHFFASADFVVRFRQASFFYFGIMYTSVLFSLWGKVRGL